MENTVKKLDKQVEISTFEVSSFEKPKPGGEVVFEVNLVAEPGEKLQKIATVEPNMPSWGTFQIRSDEGKALGGNDESPPPLSYLSAGVAFCLLSQMSMYIKAKKLNVESLKLEQRMRFSTQTNADPNGPPASNGSCDGLEIHVVVTSDESPEVIQEFIDASTGTCMALKAIVNAIPQSTVVHLNGQKLES